MSTEDNKAVVRRAYEVGMNNKDWSVLDEVFSPKYVVHFPGTASIHGYAAFKPALETFLAAFPDMEFVVEDQVAEGDKVTTRWTGRGTHSGEYMGFPEAGAVIPPSGRSVAFSANDIYRVVDGKIVEEWNSLESPVILHQIGAAPSAG